MKRGVKSRQMPVRKLAEWITLAVSVATILGFVAYLVLDLVNPASPYVDLVATPLQGEAQRVGERYVLPIEIANRGGKTVSYASFSIAISGGGVEQTSNVEVEYLARDSKQRVYKYLDRDPANLKIRVVADYYRLE